MPTISQTSVRMKSVMGIRFERILDYTGPASYATGGDSFAAGDVSLGIIESVDPGIALDANGANPRLLTWNPTTQKMQWFVPSSAAEVAAAVDLSGYTVRVQVFGK
jgi:hypothetical protein